ncbi:MAG: hypothetical protein GY750_16945 [Lentisphaerae bacterium]|nr:hypothetical protein [Lentisphaerota bacterium]
MIKLNLVKSKKIAANLIGVTVLAGILTACSSDYSGERHINKDGSITYILKSSNVIEGKYNYYYGKLTFNFSGMIQCSLNLFSKVCLRHTNKQVTPAIYKSRLKAYEELILVLNFPSMELPAVKDKSKWPRKVTIKISSLYEPYRLKRWYRVQPGIKVMSNGGFGATHKMEKELRCRKIAEISPKFIVLRKPSQEAILATENNPKETNCTIYRPPRKHTHFLFKDRAMLNPLAKGNCQDSDSKYDECEFDVWLPQQRIANVKFYKQHLKKFPKMYEQIVSYLTDKIVEEASFNRVESKLEGTKTKNRITMHFEPKDLPKSMDKRLHEVDQRRL